MVSLFIFFTSCKKDNELSQTSSLNDTITSMNGRLVFSTTAKFASTFKALKENSTQTSNYNDLLASVLGKQNYNLLNKQRFLKSGNIDSTYESPSDTLVSDPVFSSLLNVDKEIEVEGTVFRITRFGTFAFMPEKRDRVLEIINLYKDKIVVNETKNS